MQSLIATRHSGYPPRVRLLLAGLLLLAHHAARVEDLPYLDWTDSRPGLTTQFVPASENHRTVGRTRRVDAVVSERRRHFDPPAASRDHDSIFALARLRTTEQYRRTIENPTFFQDTALVNHEDAIFAGYYFKAFDAWCAGRHDAVPPAWPPPSRPPPTTPCRRAATSRSHQRPHPA